MGQLQAKNPQGYQMINQAMNSGGNPQAMLQQMLGGVSPSQKQQILNQAKSMGIPNDVLTKIQNMK